MAADDLIDNAANDVADGRPVDWHALAPLAQNDAERERLECLRIVAAIGDVHRSSIFEDGGLEPVGAGGVSDAPPGEGGDAWGRYRLIEVVGTGSFGSVYRACPGSNAKSRSKSCTGTSPTRSFESGCSRGRALAKVRHHASACSASSPTAIARSVHGFVWRNARGAAPARRRARVKRLLVGQDVPGACGGAPRGFVHRDVKARNIMRRGPADRSHGLRNRPPAIGRCWRTTRNRRRRYASSRCSGPAASACSDVYSVGVLLYHLVTGAYPVEGRTIDDLRAAHMAGRRTPVADRAPDLPVRFVQVVEQALAADPDRRCPSAGVLLEQLAGVDPGREPLRGTRRVLAWGLGAIAFVATLTLLGIVNTRYFNGALGRSDYSNEGVRDWFYWGAVSSVAPAVLSCLLLVGGLLAVIKRLLVSSSSRATDRAQGDGAQAAAALTTQHPVIGRPRCRRRWSSAPAGKLAAARRVDEQRVDNRDGELGAPVAGVQAVPRDMPASFIWVTMACVPRSSWCCARASNRRAVGWGVVAGRLAVTLLSVLLLDFPCPPARACRVQAARWRGENCYIIGERGDEFLLFCPAGPRATRGEPRTRATWNRRGTQHFLRSPEASIVFTVPVFPGGLHAIVEIAVRALPCVCRVDAGSLTRGSDF